MSNYTHGYIGGGITVSYVKIVKFKGNIGKSQLSGGMGLESTVIRQKPMMYNLNGRRCQSIFTFGCIH